MTAVIDYGWGWRIPRPGARDRLLSWWPDCGALVLEGPDGLDVLGFFASVEEIRLRLEGWEEVHSSVGALEWVRARVAGRVAGELGEEHHPRPAVISRPEGRRT